MNIRFFKNLAPYVVMIALLVITHQSKQPNSSLETEPASLIELDTLSNQDARTSVNASKTQLLEDKLGLK